MADACSVASYRKLAWTAGWHLREDTYRQALATLVNAQQRQPLAALFGTADVSSSDGQAFLTAGRGEALGAHNDRHGHGREPSAMFYTPRLVAARAVSHGINPTLGRGGLRHRRFASPRGGSQRNCPSHGRWRGERPRVCLDAPPGVPLRPAHPQPRRPQALRFRSGLDVAGAGAVHCRKTRTTKLITAQWDDVLRLTTSVRTGTVSASLLLKRLGAYPRQNGLALALREIGRIERTLHALDWLERPQLRRQATAELNKGESRNALCRAVCFHRLGRAARPHRPEPAALRQRPRPGHCGYRTLEHHLSRPSAGGGASPRRPDPGRAARPPRPARLAAHQPYW